MSVPVQKTPDRMVRRIMFSCDPVGIRTQDPQLRRLLLYPAELPDRTFIFAFFAMEAKVGAKIVFFVVTASEKAILASFFLDDVRRHFYTYHQQEACEGEHYCSSDVRVDLPCVHLHDSIGAGCVHDGTAAAPLSTAA